LLLLGGIARQREGMADPGKNETGNTAFEWLKKHQFPPFEREDQVTLTNFDAVCGGESVDVLGVKAEAVECSKKVSGGRIRGRKRRATEKKQNEQGGADAHLFSVVTFGMVGQGGGSRVRSAD